MAELGWVRLSEGALEHLLDHLVGARHSGFGVIEYRDIASVAKALWEIKDHNLNLMVTPWHDDDEPAETFKIHDKETGRVIANMEAWLAQKAVVAGLDLAEGSSESVEVSITGRGPVAPEEEKAEGENLEAEAGRPETEDPELAEKRAEARKRKAVSRKNASRQLAEEAGFTLDDFEAALAKHGQDVFARFLSQGKLTTANIVGMCRREGYPVPSAVRWLKHLAEPEKAEVAERRLPPLMPWARARHCCYTRVWADAREKRLVDAWMSSGAEGIEAFLKGTYETDEYGVRVP